MYCLLKAIGQYNLGKRFFNIFNTNLVTIILIDISGKNNGLYPQKRLGNFQIPLDFSDT